MFARLLTALLIVATLGATASHAPSRGASIAVLQSNNACRNVGFVSNVLPSRSPRQYLTPSSKTCSCPNAPSCSTVLQNQSLFGAEALYSGGGKIVFKSALGGVPTFTCIMSRRALDIIYPNVKHRDGVPVVQIVAGATSCQVTDGPARAVKKANAVFIAGNTEITIKGDPVFGLKRTKAGALVQVKKGTVRVAAGVAGATTVGETQQVFVEKNAKAPGDVAVLQNDASLKPALCALTPDLRETGVIPAVGGNAGSHPQGLAADSRGNIWFTDDGATPAIGRLDLGTGEVTETTAGLNAGSVPRWIAADADGNIWFTDDGTTPAIGMVDPTSGVITEYRTGLDPGSIPWAITYDRVSKQLWFTDQAATRPAIGTVDPATKRITEYSAGLNIGSHPEGIDVAPGGQIWFTDDNDPNPAIGTINRVSHVSHEYSKGLRPGSLPRGIAAGPGGKLWFADERTRPPHNSTPNAPGDGLIGSIDPHSKVITEYSVADNGGNEGSIPEGLAADSKGHVWFTDDGATKAIGMIDPVTGAITESATGLDANSEPIGIVLNSTGLWFTDQHPTPRIGRISAQPSC
jgi:virginiamycin B lyase